MYTIIPVAALAFLAAILLVPAWLENRTRLASLQLLHTAADKGTLDPTTVQLLLEPPKKKRSSGRWFTLICLFFGLSGLSLGIALMIGANVFGYRLDPSGNAAAGIMMGALINGMAGLGLTTLGIVSRKVFARAGEDAPTDGVATWFAQVCLFLGVSGAAVGIALALAAQFLAGGLDIPDQGRAGMALGALVTGFSGISLTALGIIVLRLFGRDPGA